MQIKRIVVLSGKARRAINLRAGGSSDSFAAATLNPPSIRSRNLSANISQNPRSAQRHYRLERRNGGRKETAILLASRSAVTRLPGHRCQPPGLDSQEVATSNIVSKIKKTFQMPALGSITKRLLINGTLFILLSERRPIAKNFLFIYINGLHLLDNLNDVQCPIFDNNFK